MTHPQERREYLQYMAGPRPRDGLRDQILLFNSAASVRQPAFKALSVMQDEPAAMQVIGTAVALVAMCEAIGIEPQHVMTRAHNVMSDASRFGPQIAAIREYARNEVLRTGTN